MDEETKKEIWQSLRRTRSMWKNEIEHAKHYLQETEKILRIFEKELNY